MGKSILYITFNDGPSGIYYSQVTDVCKYLNTELNAGIKLVSFISLRSFSENRQAIRKEFPGAMVLPMVPKLKFWRLNIYSLFLIALVFRPSRIFARGPYATWLALRIRWLRLTESVCFDARGAYAAELTEYNVVEEQNLKNEITRLEAEVLEKSDYRLAVSEQLLDYWRTKFGYSGNNHVVIPCTLGIYFQKPLPAEARITEIRKSLGFTDKDIIVAYSGSSAGWQSFKLINEFLSALMGGNPEVRILFMAKHMLPSLTVKEAFSARVVQKWVEPADVSELLAACDYGIIIREPSVTNSVSSPVKFAEYLSCGLKILISEQIGDYTSFVRKHQCGEIIDRIDRKFLITLPTREEKLKCNELALSFFSKSSCKKSYQQLLL